jgi:hypothetical protein
MKEDNAFYVGVDVSKAKHAIAIAEGGRHGEVAAHRRRRGDGTYGVRLGDLGC